MAERITKRSIVFTNSLIAILLACTATAQSMLPLMETLINNKKGIAIELRLKPDQLKDSGKLYFAPVEYVVYNQSVEKIKIPSNGIIRIERRTTEPEHIDFSKILNNKGLGNYLTEPGDDVVIRCNNNTFQFSGLGFEKYELQYRLDSIGKNIPAMEKKKGIKEFYLDSLGDFIACKNYCQYKLERMLPLFEKYKGGISEYAFAFIKDSYINEAYSQLSDKFQSLIGFGIGGKKLPAETLVQIYDSIFFPAVEKWIKFAANGQILKLSQMHWIFDRAFYFDEKQMLSINEARLLSFRSLLQVYQGIKREWLAVNVFPKKLMLSMGFTPAVEELLATYYATPGFPEWKKWVKEKEQEIRVKKLGNQSPEFNIPDNNGRLISNKDLTGKFALLNFQNGDARSTGKTAAIIQMLKAKFSNRQDIVLVNISTEKNITVWQTTILSKKSKNVIHLSTGGMGTQHSIIKDYVITSYPWIWIMGPGGKILNTDHQLDGMQNNEDLLAQFIQKSINDFKIAEQKSISSRQDGPYIFNEENGSKAYYVDNLKLNKIFLSGDKEQIFQVQTDLDKKFTVKLLKSLSIQPSEYPAVDRLLALSDIEGNFDAFRKLLQKNMVIDENFNWIFGNGHLVFAGDMFDRGDQVTECLWLLYSLEEKAKAAGGYVHFVLGNHEIMNMQGNHYYSAMKYKANAKLIGKTLAELYNENSEIGRWLRTKNVIEKVGDILFLHAGISPEINRSSLSMVDINAIARPYYGCKLDSTNKDLLMVYDTNKGEGYRISPFWSRAYYQGNKITSEQLDTTLQKFNVRHIVTGHTIVADTVSLHYGNKVINVDTKHKKGRSEALLIEKNNYYRVNSEGGKVLLFVDEKRKLSESN